jgi:hypothetical protein
LYRRNSGYATYKIAHRTVWGDLADVVHLNKSPEKPSKYPST